MCRTVQLLPHNNHRVGDGEVWAWAYHPDPHVHELNNTVALKHTHGMVLQPTLWHRHCGGMAALLEVPAGVTPWFLALQAVRAAARGLLEGS